MSDHVRFIRLDLTNQVNVLWYVRNFVRHWQGQVSHQGILINPRAVRRTEQLAAGLWPPCLFFVMISFYFGLPGSGKTTLLASLAARQSKLIEKGKSKYKIVLSNVNLSGLSHFKKIDFDMVGIYLIEDAYVLIDEASIFCDNRDWKNFSKSKVAFMMLHRHYNCEFHFFSQTYNGYDSKLRSITENVYLTKRGLLPWFTRYTKIPYGIIIPDRKDNAGNKFGEIIEGYCKPNIFERLFAPRIFRPKYYKYFDSYDRPLVLKPFDP